MFIYSKLLIRKKYIYLILKQIVYLLYIVYVLIRLGIQNITTLVWGGKYEKIDDLSFLINDVNGDVQLQGNSSYTFPFDLKPGKRVLLRGHIIDSHGCIGFDGNSTVSSM